jgi:hypothetical protein
MPDLAPGESTDFTLQVPIDGTAEIVITAVCSKCERRMELPVPVDLKGPQQCRHTCACGTEYAFELRAKRSKWLEVIEKLRSFYERR